MEDGMDFLKLKLLQENERQQQHVLGDIDPNKFVSDIIHRFPSDPICYQQALEKLELDQSVVSQILESKDKQFTFILDSEQENNYEEECNRGQIFTDFSSFILTKTSNALSRVFLPVSLTLFWRNDEGKNIQLSNTVYLKTETITLSEEEAQIWDIIEKQRLHSQQFYYDGLKGESAFENIINDFFSPSGILKPIFDKVKPLETRIESRVSSTPSIQLFTERSIQGKWVLLKQECLQKLKEMDMEKCYKDSILQELQSCQYSYWLEELFSNYIRENTQSVADSEDLYLFVDFLPSTSGLNFYNNTFYRYQAQKRNPGEMRFFYHDILVFVRLSDDLYTARKSRTEFVMPNKTIFRIQLSPDLANEVPWLDDPNLVSDTWGLVDYFPTDTPFDDVGFLEKVALTMEAKLQEEGLHVCETKIVENKELSIRFKIQNPINQ